MQLDKLLKERPTEVEVEYPLAPLGDGDEASSGFFVTLRYVGLPELERVLGDKKVNRKVLKGNRVKDLGSVNDALRQAICRAILGWRGLTKEVLMRLNLDLDPEAVEAMPDVELPCTNENKVILLKHDAEFFRWVQDIASDINEMREIEAGEEAKNSPTSQGGTPSQA